MTASARDSILIVVLVLTVVLVFAPALYNDFVTYDDNLYVTANAHVRAGLSTANVLWAFTSASAANWHPLTWMSHLLDYTFYGMNPAGHHLTSLLIHTLNAALLYLFLARATGSPARAFVVAALFALHPLRVESVAWIAERKDVLSGLFGIASLWAYTIYARNPARSRYLVTLGLFALGLLAKPMLVTLPLMMLLLDYWPLERTGPRALFIEKIPFFAAAVFSSAITIVVQARGGAVGSFEQFPMIVRLANAATAYAAYLGKTILPRHLAILYPHPGASISYSMAACAAVMLLLATIAILRLRRTRPYLAVGWLWYGIMLMPVIGILQIGDQAYADRYTYLPTIGVCIAAVWLIGDLVKSVPVKSLMACAAIVPCAFLTNQQTRVWHDTETLFRHTIAVTGPNKIAHVKLGCAQLTRGQLDGAAREFDAALAIDPHYAGAMGNLGMVLLSQGKLEPARQTFDTALSWKPDSVFIRANLGIVLFQTKHVDEAFRVWDEALHVDPTDPDVHFNRGVALTQLARYPEAETDLAVAYSARPWDAEAAYALGVALMGQGNTVAAGKMFERTLELEPRHAQAVQALKAIGLAEHRGK